MRTLLVLPALLCALVSHAAQAGKSRAPRPKDAFATAVERYRSVDYEGCLEALARAGDELSTEAEGPTRTARSAALELYRGLCHFGTGNSEQARHHFREALTLDASVEPPAGTSPKVRRTFAEVALLLKAEAQERATRPEPAPALPPAPAPAGPDTATAASVPSEALPAAPAAPASPRSSEGRRWVVPSILGAVAVAAAATGYFVSRPIPALEERSLHAPYLSEYDQVVAEGRARTLGANVAFAGGAAAAIGAVLVLVF